ncbi:MAG: molybdopterin dinucleotide binding domain-containing protein [Candidatus Syntropharchaeales archaeon]
MGISSFIQSPAYEVMILIVPDIFQSSAGYAGKFSEAYQNASAQIYLDHEDMKEWSIKDGSKVELFTDFGEVVLTARESEEEHRGIGLMPPSVYSMRILSLDNLHPAKIRRSEGEVAGIREIIGK